MTERQSTTLFLLVDITQSLSFSPAQTTPMQEKLAFVCGPACFFSSLDMGISVSWQISAYAAHANPIFHHYEQW